MSVLDALNNYYNGQKVMTFFFGFMGSAIYLLLAWLAATRKGLASQSSGRTILAFVALFILPANVIYVLYLYPQFARYASLLARDPNAFRDAELLHLHKMIPGFLVSISSFGALVCVGLVITTPGSSARRRDGRELAQALFSPPSRCFHAKYGAAATPSPIRNR